MITTIKRFINGALTSNIARFSSSQVSSELSSTSSWSLPSNLNVESTKVFTEIEQNETAFQDEVNRLSTKPIDSFSVEVIKFGDSNSPPQVCHLPESVFGVPIRQDIVQAVIIWQRAKRRQPHKTKRPGDLRGSNKKPHPQKGQGRARFGYKRAPQRRGGYKAHGPVLRSFAFKLNRKFRLMGLKIALAAKLREGRFHLVDSFSTTSHKTQIVKKLVEDKIGKMDEGKRILFVDGALDEKTTSNDQAIKEENNFNFQIAISNIQQLSITTSQELDVYEMVKSDDMVVSVRGLNEIFSRFDFNPHRPY